MGTCWEGLWRGNTAEEKTVRGGGVFDLMYVWNWGGVRARM